MAKSQSFIFMTLLLLFSLVFGFGVNGIVSNGDTKLDPRSILKTIVAGDEIIDCVDIYKQPAFNHPLLKNHTLQLEPSSYPSGSKSIVSINSTKLTQMWHRTGEYCPKGTIPILRSSAANIPPKNIYDRRRVFNNADPNSSNQIPHPEVATVSMTDLNIYGGNADMSVWNPNVQSDESSSSQIWLTTDGGGDTIEAIEAGWIVKPSEPYPTFFTYWTVDGYGTSGCYNLDCPGFVQTTWRMTLGTQVDPVSIYGGEEHFINVKIYKDFKTGTWWLNIDGWDIGYWPARLFTKLNRSAQKVQWGGRVVNTKPKGLHTTTQMGSGHFPREGQGKAAQFHNLEFIGENEFYSHAIDVEGYATRPECYEVKVQDWDKDLHTHFFYGGRGYSDACQ